MNLKYIAENIFGWKSKTKRKKTKQNQNSKKYFTNFEMNNKLKNNTA